MEALVAPLESLLWVLTPAGAIISLILFGLLASGFLGRIVTDLEVSRRARRSSGDPRALEAGAGRERIMR